MNKKHFTYLLALLLVAFTSCEGPEGPMGPAGRNGQDGQDGQDGWANFQVIYYTVEVWTLSEDETLFYADADCPELTDFVYDEGVVMGYYMFNYNTTDEVQIPLPFDIYKSDGEVLWTETISFDFVPGGIRFYYEPSDFFTGFSPPDCTIKIALMW